MKLVLFAIAAFAASISTASAYCRSPGRAPEPPKNYERPRPPQCLQQAGDSESKCDRYELDRHSQEVANYIRKLEDYVYEAERYADAAAKYAACEADEARESLSN